eukprot:TRINITY_DN3860_c0_g1_i1.p1 TRINITY_DN3860_c0_g1~~TRINITY_DN3860_c0_g1_i1.p1  ORF type:complete len:109 (+),score=20.25 TRINITY_DN3860_c0_g1_i1:81-407(+)
MEPFGKISAPDQYRHYKEQWEYWFPLCNKLWALLKTNERQFTDLQDLWDKETTEINKQKIKDKIKELYDQRVDEVSKVRNQYSQLNTVLQNIKARMNEYFEESKTSIY